MLSDAVTTWRRPVLRCSTWTNAALLQPDDLRALAPRFQHDAERIPPLRPAVSDAVRPVVITRPDGVPVTAAEVVAPCRVLCDQNPTSARFYLVGKTFQRAVSVPAQEHVTRARV